MTHGETYDDTFMLRAIALSQQALDQKGLEPFGAVVVRDGVIIGEGVNRSVLHHDPTSHGETEAIRDACRRLGTVDLRGATLYSSCEPCALCVAAMAIAGIAQLHYAVDMGQAGAVLGDLPEHARFPIDVDHLMHECGRPLAARRLPATQARSAEAVAVLQAWAAQRMPG